MSRTLFWYVFKDLLRIFFLASGALAGIMSFGGLLRPVYEHGLDAAQVAKLLGYFMPAMTTYSLPIAALFATTMVYGRLSADNEVTAARAAGISHLSLTLPALVMGLLIALISLLFLCFVVPIFWLRIERVIYSNMAELVANQIQRTHQIRFQHAQTPVTVFAQDAVVLPPHPQRPHDQVVELIAPMIVTYDNADKNNPAPPPEEFYTASKATAWIRHSADDTGVTLLAELTNGMRFPRRPLLAAQRGGGGSGSGSGSGAARESVQVSIGSTQFGPIALPSPVRENTKFMDVLRLRSLLDFPERSRRVRGTLLEFVTSEQQQEYLNDLRIKLSRGPLSIVEFDAGDEHYELRPGGAEPDVRRNRLTLAAPDGAAPVTLVQRDERGQVVLDVEAREVRVRCFPDTSSGRVEVRVDLIDCVVGSRQGALRTPRPGFDRSFSVAMPPELALLEERAPRHYLTSDDVSQGQQQRLWREVLKLNNGVVSELNARASFGVSCFILVMVGCALGMMFRSGNFLSAFAVSVVPALLCIALVVTGQHTCENVPWSVNPAQWNNPLHTGLLIIWSGNVAVAAIAIVLLWRLQRQ
jgi:lipopolysaccharide export LptBFGC system permease protein LptF